MKEINHEYYVSLEVAKLLKEAGFDWEVMSFYTNDITEGCESEYELRLVKFDNWNGKNKTWCDLVSAPTLDVAQRWLREVKYCYLDVMVESDVDDDGNITFDGFTAYYVFIGKPHGLADSDGVIYGNFDTYESTLEAGIKKALEIILEKGE